MAYMLYRCAMPAAISNNETSELWDLHAGSRTFLNIEQGKVLWIYIKVCVCVNTYIYIYTHISLCLSLSLSLYI